MIITSIKKDKNHLNKINLDNGSVFFLDTDICVDNCLKEGKEITDSELKQFYETSQYARAKSRALWYLNRMDYSEKKLYDKLVAADFEKEVCAKVIARLIELDLVNDRRFAERYAQRCIDSNISKRETVMKLWEKGISKDLALEVLEEIEINEPESLKNLIARKYAYKLTQQNGTQKVFAALVRKGFSYSDVRQALKDYIVDKDFCED